MPLRGQQHSLRQNGYFLSMNRLQPRPLYMLIFLARTVLRLDHLIQASILGLISCTTRREYVHLPPPYIIDMSLLHIVNIPNTKRFDPAVRVLAATGPRCVSVFPGELHIGCGQL